MRNLVCPFLFLVLLLANPFGTTVTALPNKSILSKKEVNKPLTRKQVEKKLGRKLKLKERIALWVLKKRIKKQKTQKVKTHPFAIIALIFSAIGIWFPFGIIALPITITFGTIALARIRKSKGKWGGKQMALLAIVLSILLILGIGLLILLSINGSR